MSTGPHAILTFFMLPMDCVLLPSGQDEVQVEAGADATLDCQGPTEGTITVIAWNKRGMQTDGYVFFYREDRPYKLGDPQMKGGNMSIILHNTTVNDTGTYECHISYQSGSGRDKRVTPEIISEISLKVVHAGESETSLPTGGHTEDGGKEDEGKEDGGREGVRKEDGSVGLIAGLSLSALVLVFGGFVIYKKCNTPHIQNSYQPPVEQQQV
uniref:Ig-like domain-containing protein n=1 Tax=Astatotilapia calliptera TaxID=8154 RepID=A0AAX7UCZ8_ASTCA